MVAQRGYVVLSLFLSRSLEFLTRYNDIVSRGNEILIRLNELIILRERVIHFKNSHSTGCIGLVHVFRIGAMTVRRKPKSKLNVDH